MKGSIRVRCHTCLKEKHGARPRLTGCGLMYGWSCDYTCLTQWFQQGALGSFKGVKCVTYQFAQIKVILKRA